jgi:hypothetical protein
VKEEIGEPITSSFYPNKNNLILNQLLGGQFEMAKGGQFALANWDYFSLGRGGQFDWVFHFCRCQALIWLANHYRS